jgi:hypothetical protein
VKNSLIASDSIYLKTLIITKSDNHFSIAISLHLIMASQTISNRYIRLKQLHTLLKRLFVAEYEVDVRVYKIFSISI